MIPWRIKINLIAFVLISVGLVYAMASQVLTILQPRYSVEAIFRDAGGVFTNQEVTYRGVTVGQVGEMKVVEDGVSIELKIDETYDEIPAEDIEARVMFKSAVGEQFVDLLPATDGEPFLTDGYTIPKNQTTIPVSTQELLSTLEAVLRGVPPEALEGAVDALGIGLTGHGPDIATIIESMADLAQLFAEKAPEVQGILREGTKVGSAFVNSSDDFKIAIKNLVEVSEELSQDREALKRLMINTNYSSDEIVAFLRDYEGEIDRFLPTFAEFNELQAEHVDDLAQMFIHLPRGLGAIVKSFEPKTGLIRFGTIGDHSSAACSYGTDRRQPYDRSFRRPPKNAHCGDSPAASRRSGAPAGSDASTAPPASDGLDLDAVERVGTATIPALPERMSDWSWSLLYLNGF